MTKPPLLALLCALVGCAEPQDAKRVELRVLQDSAGLAVVTTDLGYRVELEQATVVIDDLRFALAGEAHASFWRTVSSRVVAEAHAHPGHYQGGEITGELPGHFVLRFGPGSSQELGKATLLVGKYQSANFTFAHATTDDAGEDDALLRQTALLRGKATKDRGETTFEVAIDSPIGRELLGIPFEYEVKEGSEDPLVLRLLTQDPLEGDTLFDGLDFMALDADGDGAVAINAGADAAAIVTAHNRVRRVFQTHDHFRFTTGP